ncbi:hypothetical protein CE91St36_16010 [Christensenellaceae bacterium]|nr:hypothetical protein CE91St36_16010 [Christensenellaceae bacterium]BDF61452.1 hypothetical protein CE91St37_16020 [Christensenellaceae bacterium]
MAHFDSPFGFNVFYVNGQSRPGYRIGPLSCRDIYVKTTASRKETVVVAAIKKAFKDSYL